MSFVVKLISAHPLLFRGVEPRVHSDLPEGWYELVHELCSSIERILGPAGCAAFEVVQVKEKFGNLRFYFTLAGVEDDFVDVDRDAVRSTFVTRGDGPRPIGQIRRVVEEAEMASAKTCQRCGATGRKLTSGGWVATLCVAHENRQSESMTLNMLPPPRSRSSDVFYLDFDGVLHPEDVFGGLGFKPRLGRQYGAGRQLFEHAALLEALLGPYESVRIVLSTSWVPAKGYAYAVKQLPPGLRTRCCGATWHNRMLPLAPIWDHLPRGQQVLEDVRRRQPKRWLAVDDDANGWSPFDAQLVISDKLHGISLPRVREELEWKLARTFGDKSGEQKT